MLRKNPGFTIAAAVTLALGIGANTAISSIVNAAILRPLPYKDSSRIVSLSTHAAMFPTFSLGLSWVDFQQIRSQASSLEEAAAYADGIKTLTGKGDPVVLRISSVSDDFFAELGIGAQAGRLLTEQDERPGREHVVVLSDALWRNRLGAQPSTVGQTLVLDRVPYTVIGISARGFAFPEKTEAWIPLSFYVSGKAEPHIFHAPRARKDPPRAKNRKTYGGVRHNRAAHHERCSGVECRLQTAP